MSCFTSRHVGATFDRERYEEIEEEANRNYEQDQASLHTDSGFGSKVLSFFKSNRISTAVSSVITSSRTLLTRLASHDENESSPSHRTENVTKSYIPATETVTFPLYIAPPAKPNVRASEALTPVSSPATPTTNSRLHFSDVPPVTGNELSRVKTDELSGFDDTRYKERTSSGNGFLEIERGIVSVRAKWLEPLLAGKKAVEKNSSLSKQVAEMSNLGDINEKPPALAVPRREEPTFEMEQLPVSSESEKDYEFDDSPRLYKHIMPKDEPKPSVQPGTVAKGALWLEPILTGKERLAGVPKGEEHSLSPTRVAEARF